MHLLEGITFDQPGWNLQLLLVLLLVCSFVTVVVKWVRLPYAVALVVAGLIIGVGHLLPFIEMTPELVLVTLLPALLFEVSWNLRFEELKASWKPIGVLATLGVVISMLVVALIMHLLSNLSIVACLMFGALISATDPISVLALFKKLGMDRRLTIILEGESLFNDGTAVVLFKLVPGLAVSCTLLSLSQAVGGFFSMVAGGVALGLCCGYLASRIAGSFDDHLLAVTLTTIVAYGSYLLAETLHLSSVIATITAGMVMGNYGQGGGLSANTRQAIVLFWEYAAFVANSLVFLLIGMQMKYELLRMHGALIATGVLAILIARAVVVYLLCPMLSSPEENIVMSWRHLLFWGALRGSLCMALALSLPLDFPQREAVIVLTFGVVLFTLLVKGLTIEPLVKVLGMN